MVTVGGSEAIDAAMRAMLNPGDEVLIPQPSYVSYVPCAVLADGVPVVIELEEKDHFKLTPEKLLEKITDKRKSWFFHFQIIPLERSWSVMSWKRLLRLWWKRIFL